MLRTRLATALVAIPALWLIVWQLWSPAFAGFILLVTGVAVAEYAAMALPGHPRYRVLAVCMGVVVAAGVMKGPPWTSAALAAALVVGMLHPLRPGVALGPAVQRLGVWWLGVTYLGFLLPHVVLLRESSPDGWRWLLFAIFVTMGSDTGGYFGGRLWGRRKLLPGVSPAKTIEGAVSSVLGAAVVAVLCGLFVIPPLGGIEAIGLAAIVSVLAQLGDLGESALKRAFGVKDSGWIIPGHGGILDRLDSLLLPFVFLYHYVALTGI